MSALSAITFDSIDQLYYMTQLNQMKFYYTLLLECKEKGVLEVQKITLDAVYNR